MTCKFKEVRYPYRLGTRYPMLNSCNLEGKRQKGTSPPDHSKDLVENLNWQSSMQLPKAF